MKHNSILELIGGTPLVRLTSFVRPEVNLWGKVEAFNPMGSVKDRMALGMIEAAEQNGELKPGQTVIEATSGNTGIGLAMVCASKGYPLVVVMPENFSIERRKLLRFLGARVVLTPAAEKGSGMVRKAEELADEHGFYLVRQFQNPANAETHYRTTGREILAEFIGESLDAFVTGFGTGGTLLGTARALRQASPATRIIVAEPDNCPVLASGIPQARDFSGRITDSHPQFRPHLMQGWSPDFVSDLTQAAVDEELIDEIVRVNGHHSLEVTRQLAQREGIFSGTSAGATLSAAIAVAEDARDSCNIVVMLPDTGERYLSTPLFADICQDMNEEELALSNSTVGCRFGVVNEAAPPPSRGKTEVDSGKIVYQHPRTSADTSAINEDEQLMLSSIESSKVVMFSLEWCEFCWTLRKFFQAVGVSYRSIDLDSLEYQVEDLGVRMRSALSDHTGCRTIPQVFVGGEYVGGCLDVLAAYDDGRLDELFSRHKICVSQKKVSTDSLLPNWVQSA